MINLFDRVYIRHDNEIVRAKGQLKLIISEKVVDSNYAENKVAQRDAGILGVYKSIGDCDEYYSGREAMWASLRRSKSKVIIIAGGHTVAGLLIQYWKSIFANATVDNMYPLYEIMVNNEKMHSIRPMEKRVNQYSPDSPDEPIEKLSKAEFENVFNETAASDILSTLELKELPFEYALLSYLIDENDVAARRVLFPKIDMIMKDNIVAQLIGSRDEMLYESHNYYLIEGKDQEVPITDPIAYMKDHPSLSWVLDDVFQYGRESDILEKYGLDKIKLFIRVVGRILFENDVMLVAIDFIKNKQYRELIEYDIGDHRGNYFGSHAYQRKINGLFVSYMYQLKRLGMTDMLQSFALK